MIKLKPCPFCGSDNLIVEENISVVCLECGATGPLHDSIDGADWDWNTRYSPRCKTCKFWIICKCTNPFRHGVEMFVGADFGCVYHKEKEKQK